jgi:hypothetical protein
MNTGNGEAAETAISTASETNPHQKIGTTIMTQLKKHQTAAPKGDRYDRLATATEIIANDQNIADAQPPLNGEGVRAFSAGLVEKRLLDGLSESDADTAAVMLLFDFPRGIDRMGWRIADVLSANPTVKWDYDDEIAVARTLTNVLYLLLGVIQGVDDESQIL